MADNKPAMYNSLSAFLKSIGYPTVDDQFVIHNMQDVSPDPPYRSPVFRANYFTFVIIRTGDSRYTLDGVEYTIKDQTVYFTNPGHLKSFQLLKPVDGKLISFSSDFLDEYVQRDPFSIFPYLLSEIVPPLYLDEISFNALWSLSEMIQGESIQSSDARMSIMGSYFKVFLLKVNSFINQDHSLRKAMDRESEILKTFKIHLEDNIRGLIRGEEVTVSQVGEFAERQHLHPSYFTTVIRNKTGKSAQAWITRRIIRESKSLLRQPELTVKQIAYKLGFSDANYFSKYFKKNAGLTPGNYRSKAQKS